MNFVERADLHTIMDYLDAEEHVGYKGAK